MLLKIKDLRLLISTDFICSSQSEVLHAALLNFFPSLKIRPPVPDQTHLQSNNPLHGATLQHIVECLAEHYGWADLGRIVPIRCFTHEPSVSSSLKFLRRTPWARAKVEALYVETWWRDRGQNVR